MPRSPLPRASHASHRSYAVELLEPRQLMAGVPSLQIMPGSISGIVHQDNLVADNRWQAGETGIAGVKIELLDGQDRVVAATQTDAAGHYRFEGLWPGEYSLREVQPTATIHGGEQIGSGGGLASDHQITGIQLLSEAELTGYNFSELPAEAVAAALLTATKVELTAPGAAAAFPFVTNGPKTATPRVIDNIVAGEEYIPNSVDGDGYSWRLSVLNVPEPRVAEEAPPDKLLHNASWKSRKFRTGHWLLGDDREAAFGLEGAVPLVGDFDGDGRHELALFLDGQWYLDSNGNGRWDDEADTVIQLGRRGDQPVVGDWNRDGRDDIGVFGPHSAATAQGAAAAATVVGKPALSQPGASAATSATDHATASVDQVFKLGGGGDVPIAGDFDGDGKASIGVFRGGMWRIDLDGDGRLTSADRTAKFGEANDAPIVGDFDSDGRAEIGVFRHGQWIIDSNHNGEIDAADKVFELGSAGDTPIVGDFNGDGLDEPGIYRDGPAARISRTR